MAFMKFKCIIGIEFTSCQASSSRSYLCEMRWKDSDDIVVGDVKSRWRTHCVRHCYSSKTWKANETTSVGRFPLSGCFMSIVLCYAGYGHGCYCGDLFPASTLLFASLYICRYWSNFALWNASVNIVCPVEVFPLPFTLTSPLCFSFL